MAVGSAVLSQIRPKVDFCVNLASVPCKVLAEMSETLRDICGDSRDFVLKAK